MFRKLALLAALATSSAAQAEWWRAETEHLIIYSEDDKADTEKFAVELERFDNALRTLQNLPNIPPEPISDANKVTIFRTGDVSDMGRIYGRGGAGVGGFYIARAGGSVAFTPVRRDRPQGRSAIVDAVDARTDLDPRSILQHEYVHHFMAQWFSTTYPDWYGEAFAELYATIALNDDGSFHVGNPPQYRAAQIFQLSDIALDELFDQNNKRDGLDHYQFYGYGWLLAHYLSFEPSRKGQLVAYLKALGQGQDGLTAARAAFGDLDKLQKEVRSYKTVARRGQFPGFDVKPANYTPPEVETRRLSEAETAVIEDFMRSKRGVDRSGARDVANSISGKAARFPNDLFVQLAAAKAFLDAKRFPEAHAAADRAIAIDAGSAEAHILKGAISIAQGKEGDKTKFADARAPLRKAARLDGQDPRPFLLYYESFRQAGETAPADAVKGLETIYPWAALDNGYRIAVGRQLLIDGRAALAKTILAPVTYEYHGDQKENKLRAVLDLIDAGKPAEALAALDAEIRKWEEEAKKG